MSTDQAVRWSRGIVVVLTLQPLLRIVEREFQYWFIVARFCATIFITVSPIILTIFLILVTAAVIAACLTNLIASSRANSGRSAQTHRWCLRVCTSSGLSTRLGRFRGPVVWLWRPGRSKVITREIEPCTSARAPKDSLASTHIPSLRSPPFGGCASTCQGGHDYRGFNPTTTTRGASARRGGTAGETHRSRGVSGLRCNLTSTPLPP